MDLALDLGAIGPPFELRAALFQPSRDFPRTVAGITPMALVRADWIPSLFEYAGLFLAARRDRTGGLAELLRGALVEDDVVSLAGHGARLADLPGVSCDLARPAGVGAVLHRHPGLGRHHAAALATFANQRLLWTLAVLRGRIDTLEIAGVLTQVDVPLRGSAAWLRYQVSPWPWFSVTPWFLYLSGDSLAAGERPAGVVDRLRRLPRRHPLHHRHQPLLRRRPLRDLRGAAGDRARA